MELKIRHAVRLLLILFVTIGIGGGTVGCKKKTPEDKLAEVEQLIKDSQMALSVLKLKELVNEYAGTETAVTARMYLARIYIQLGGPENVRNASEQLEKVVEQVGVAHKDGAVAYQVLIDMYLQLDQYDKAEEHAQKGIALFTEADPSQKNQMEMIHASILLRAPDEERRQQGADFFRRAMVEMEDPTLRGQAKEILANYYREQKLYEESNQVYDEYIAAFPDDPVVGELYLGKAINMQIAGNREKAMEFLAEGEARTMKRIDEELDSKHRARMLRLMAQYYEIFAEYEKAEQMLRRVMSELPMSLDAIEAQIEIGIMYGRMQQFDKAIAHFEQIARENPNSNIEQTALAMVNQIKQMQAMPPDQRPVSRHDALSSPTATPEAPPAP